MSTIKDQIIDILNTIEGGSAFCTFGKTTQIIPGLYLEGYGEISFPFSTTTYQELLKFSEQAPFGKGEQTITDTSVRSTQEIDASMITFKNPLWEKTLQNIVESVKVELAIEDKTVQASLYKLLIYKEGDFFLPHRDSEKEKGMFGSLVIGLPAKHQGGELVVNFDGHTKSKSFSEDIDQYKMPYAAFYADCEHEIKEITEGYRVCLVYNLIQVDQLSAIKSPSYHKQVSALANVFSTTALKDADKPSVLLLNHQYTPKNFGLSLLKRNDAPQAKVIIEAAEKAGYFAKPALLTCYQMGDMQPDYDFHDYGYGSTYDTEDLLSCEMGEVHEEGTLVEHWAEDVLPGLGQIEVSPEEIISKLNLKDDEPIQKEGEGYTGNAGMTMEYWYHYAAVVVWPKAKNSNILKNSSVEVKLKWLSYYLKPSDTQSNDEIKLILKELSDDEFSVNNYWYKDIDFSPVPLAYIFLNHLDFTQQPLSISLLVRVFTAVKSHIWVDFFKTYPTLLNEILTKVAAVNKLKNLLHLSLFLKEFSQADTELFEQKGMTQFMKMPEYLHSDQIYKNASQTENKTLLNTLIYLSHQYVNESWLSDLLSSITMPELTNRKYVNKVLVDVLLSLEEVNNTFAIKLAKYCLQDLKKRIANKPTPPENWTRAVPKSASYKKQWSVLKDFLESPTQEVFDYAIKQADRLAMQNAIDSVVIDLKYVTIKKGSPHTLRITKTQKAFEKKLREWHQDLSLLQSLKTKFSGLAS